jgi:peptidoglycan/LPS O-acetylase OafA/YrhL
MSAIAFVETPYIEIHERTSTSVFPSYLPWLDLLRFFACFLVIVLHTVPGIPSGVGHAGVALFFSLSGFLIGRGLVAGQSMSSFYARRFLRIYPAYLATLLFLGIFLTTPFLHDSGAGPLFFHNIGYYLTFTFQLSPDSVRLPLLIVWSLCVEELFYLFVPLIFLLRSHVRITVTLLAIVAVLLVPRFSQLPDGTGLWFVLPINLFFGVLLALAKPEMQSGRYRPIIGVVAILLVVTNGFANWFHSFGPVSAFLCTAAVWSLAVYPGSAQIAPAVSVDGQAELWHVSAAPLLPLACVALARWPM